MKESRVTALAALISLAALTGCGGNPKPNTGQQAALYCPQVALLQQAQTLSTFLPGRSDVAAQLTTAQITGFSGECVLEKHKRALLVTVKPAFQADNGPANNGQPLTLPWFAAITQDDSIISKSPYNVTLKFNGNVSMAFATGKPAKIEVPNVPDSAQLQILVGFEMTPDQQAYAAAHPNATP
ncbi:MAG: hypothetical protein ACLPJJ_05620 [Acidocella sp.]|uniref:hypothetical protein n=1 Tax=Acidocella sp. TaxID=50710 RepID=UPI003FC4751E